MALFGSDTEREVGCMAADHGMSVVALIRWFVFVFQVKKASAETEPAWKGAGQKVGMQIWRIVKFKVSAAAAVSQSVSQLAVGREGSD